MRKVNFTHRMLKIILVNKLIYIISELQSVPIPKTDVGSDVRSDVGTDVGNDVGTAVGTDVGSDPKILRDFIFKRNGKISIDFFC